MYKLIHTAPAVKRSYTKLDDDVNCILVQKDHSQKRGHRFALKLNLFTLTPPIYEIIN